MPEEPFDLRALLAVLNANGVSFVLIGGLAMMVHGSSHVTQDIDIAYDRTPANQKALANALASLKPKLRGADVTIPFQLDERTLRSSINLTLTTDIGDIDILGEVPGRDFRAIFDGAIEIELRGEKVLVASLDDLILMKKAANRPKDRLHVMELEALKGLLEGE